MNRVLILVCTIYLTVSCRQDSTQKIEKIDFVESSPVSSKQDSIILINECHSESYKSKLEENLNLDSNAFVLTIQSRHGLIKKQQLNLRPKGSKINYCTDRYVVVGFSCGGPCYAQFFIFTSEDRPVESFAYCQRIPEHLNIVAHIKNENFSTLTIHNFDTNKELNIELPDYNDLLSYGHMDTMYIEKNDLSIQYFVAFPKNRTV
jgi:hypothetical protein